MNVANSTLGSESPYSALANSRGSRSYCLANATFVIRKYAAAEPASLAAVLRGTLPIYFRKISNFLSDSA